MNDIERHVQQTTDRLHCIKQQLQSPTDFQHAARELLEWCMDDRAFQPHFEAPLFNCLAVVGRVSSQHGFDLDLGYRLLSVCAAHHDKFSVKSAGLLTSWSEELGQMLLQRQQLKRTIGGGPTASAADFKQRLAADGSFYAAANERQMVSKPPMAGSARYSSVPASWQHPQNSAVQQWDSISHSEKMLSNTGPGFNEEHQQQQLVDHTMAVAGPLQQIQHHQQHNGSVQAMQASMVPGSVTGNGSVYSKSGPGAAYCSNGTVGNPSFNNGYPPTPTSPGNSSTQSGALLGDAVMTGDSSVAMTTTLTTAAPPVTMATNASSYGNGWQRNDGSSVGARAPNDVVFNGHRQQQTRMYAADAYGNSQYYSQQYCGPSRGQVPQSSSSLHRYYPYPPSSSRLGVPLQSNMVHDVAGGTHHHHHHHSASSSLQSPYPANAQQYMKCKRAMCPTSMQPVYGLYRSSQAQSPYYPARSVVAHGHQPALPIQSQSRAGVHYGIGEVQPVNHASYHGQNGVTNSGFGQSPEYTSSHQPEYSISTDGDPSLLLETQAYNNQHQLPGNPTPPITPGSCGSTAYSTAVRSSANELTEPCMTFPLPDGIIMPPFRLQHNLAVSNHVFRLNESVYQALACRSDLELQLKCFHHEDREMTTNWPASVMVSVNANPMTIDVHRPINVRDVCQLGRNTIQITVMACCCSHMFVLQLVHRPAIRLVVTSLLRKQMLSTEQSIAKLKQHCMSTEGVKLSLVCPITLAQIKLPARGRDCHHLQCFDVEAYLSLNSERSLWRCPICKRTVALEEIEVDQLLWSILETQRASATIGDEVVVDVAQMSWRVITKTGSVLDETGNGSLLTSVPLAASLQPNVDTWLTSSSMGNKVITDPDHEGMSHSPDILTSLAQMGDSLEQIPMEMNPADAPPESQQTPDLSNLPPVGALVNEGVSSPLAHRGSPEIGALQLKEVDITNAPTPPAAAVDFAGAPAIPTPPDTTGVSSASSTCMISSVTSLESLTGAEGHQSPTDSIDTSFHSDLSLDMLVTESAIGDPSELLAYLGPSDSDAGFGSSEDLLSLFSPE